MTSSASRPRAHTTNSRTRLLVLATTVPAREGDGVPSFVLDLAAQLSTEMDVTILAPRVTGAPRRTSVGNVAVRRFAFFPRRWEGLADDAIMPTLRAQPWRWIEVPFLVAAMAWSAWRVSGPQKFSVVHAHWIIPTGLVALLLKRVRGLSYIVTAHGADAHTLNGRAVRWLKQMVLRDASAVVPVSSGIEEVVASLAGPECMVTAPIPMGVPPASVEQADRSAGPFLFVGRIAEKKGLAVALEAMRAVPEARLRVVGDGPELEESLRLAARLGIDERVEFLGRKPKGEVLAEMARCRALLIPSIVAADGDTDGTPVVMAEAMSVGAPVVASQLAGLADYIVADETGVLVAPGDVAAWSRAIGQAQEDPSRVFALGREGARRFASGPLDIGCTAQQYGQILEESMS